jgi:signal peptidase II
MTRKRVLFFLAALVVVVLDQSTKAWARGALAHGPQPILDGAVFCRLGMNPGIAFSMFRGGGEILRVLVSILGLAMAAGVVLYAWRSPRAHAPFLIGLGLVAAGALGNVIDRLAAGRVTDFLVIKIAGHEWPAFNVADAALVVGVLFLLVSRREPEASTS